ncbi:hypothetical protein [Aeromonas hydrophila]|uniref:Lipoprotein n=1 Tax=Aeromonas hydrophila TaxID=644 RepID=A0ABD7G479_AERHY|nr:hypothetical protein [Aeromonas hydrophila]RCF46451.1 hypothetical protein C6C11_17250 [Aeromonas hydrophila]
MNLRVVFALAACVGLVACGEDADDVPPPEKRQVSVLVMDTSAAENPVLKFRAEDVALSDVLKKVGPLTKSQIIALRCEGGYNKQPPLYSLDFDIVRGNGGATENLLGVVDTATMHEVCVKKMRSHKN